MINKDKIEKNSKSGIRSLGLGICSGMLAIGVFLNSVGISEAALVNEKDKSKIVKLTTIPIENLKENLMERELMKKPYERAIIRSDKEHREYLESFKIHAKIVNKAIEVTNLSGRTIILDIAYNDSHGDYKGIKKEKICIENGKIKLNNKSASQLTETIKYNNDFKNPITVKYNYDTKVLNLLGFDTLENLRSVQITGPEYVVATFYKSDFNKPVESEKKEEKPKTETPKEEKPKENQPKVETPKKELPKKEDKEETEEETEEERQRRKERERREDETARDRRNNQNQKYKKGWNKVSEKWYYTNDGVKFVRSSWIYDEGYSSWYYLNEYGEMTSNKWVQYSDGSWYYLLENGKMAVSKWVKHTDNNWYYLLDNGKMAVSEWVKHTNSWYYLLENGKMAKSEWVYDKKYVSWYYFNNGGDMAKNKWIQHTDNNWYYLLGDGKMAKSTTINGWYVDANGIWKNR
ncbi:hypothetical protein [Helcococcus ovis]|uniref:hypothetical protein n=1 Tax=Helcococcus ovis TaxID=72026 RepID=UPI0038B7C3D1